MAALSRKKTPVGVDAPTLSEAAIAEVLSERIAQGRYPAGDTLPAERALATEFGVDRSVVRMSIAALERRRLVFRNHGCRPRVGQPDQGETVVPSTRPKTRRDEIAVLLPYDANYPAAINTLQGINEYLRLKESSFRSHFIDTCTPEMEDRAIDLVEADKFAGLIVWHTGDPQTLARLMRLQDKGVPIIFVDRYAPDMDCDFVGPDNLGSAFDAVKYLLDLGHRHIVHVTSYETMTSVILRRQGYQEALLTEGIAFDPDLVVQTQRADLPDVLARLLAQPNLPTAIFAMNDSIAHGVIVAAEECGLRVPDDLSVMGFDDLERYSPRPALLTTIHQPFNRIGQRATDLLIERLSTPRSRMTARRHILLYAPIVVRSTCRAIDAEGTR